MVQVNTTESISEATRTDGYKITVDLDKCIAAGPCSIAAPLTFLLRDSDGKAVIADPDGDTFEKVLEAARCCPILAIIIKDKNGKQIFP
ncbi:MAG: Ferredoxin [Candidatus Collierbacteria bacterium GW2011_GWB1_44_6]|uniref:Ferredoxin n=2 Tax=Candidatus Collieribacteriota TaxID=1752725 RepID=A0A0G1MP27_9BACT|nr:MAG: Ferredoxin [Candidatus Collierbacteria bacterium GW2011_GWC2_43_12]KKT73769.1 MAG: Ferredoxin [Candidatus Collierbacteria bacterium GW2011_GWB1_44_6]KKT83747.1 MAG: Ferredoxin [Microgenomates group bacterium GW2011_GWC1_44_9]